MKNNPKVYIIILNWNGYDDTIVCVQSVLKITYDNYKILLIDNGSSHDEYKKLHNFFKKEERIAVIKNERNLGFAGGVNTGIKRSIKDRVDYTLLLNNDTIVDENFVKELVAVAETNLKIGVVSSKVFYYDRPKKVWAAGSYFNYYFPPFSKNYIGSRIKEVTDIVGCVMLINNNLFKKIGLFDEEYFAYGEESDFNFRTKKAGYKIYITPSSKVWHKISQSTGGGFNKTVAYLKMRNKIKFAKKNYPLKYWPSYLLFLILYFGKEQIKAFLSLKFSTSIALLKGLRDGI